MVYPSRADWFLSVNILKRGQVRKYPNWVYDSKWTCDYCDTQFKVDDSDRISGVQPAVGPWFGSIACPVCGATVYLDIQSAKRFGWFR